MAIEGNKKYLDLGGLQAFWGKAKAFIAAGYDVKGAAAAAEAAAKLHAETKASEAEAAAKLHAETKASAAEAAAKLYADGLKTTIDAAYAAADSQVLADAKLYAEGQASAAQTAAEGHADSAAAGALTDAKAYTVEYADVKGAAATAESNAKAYAKEYADAELKKTNDAASELGGKVTKLIGNDADKSVRTIANEELAAQLLSGKADADFKTLQELAAWLEDHPESAASMSEAIEANKTAIATEKGRVDAIENDYLKGADKTTLEGLISAEEQRATGVEGDRKSTRLNSSHTQKSRMPSSA